jgi:hypothetical protein
MQVLAIRLGATVIGYEDLYVFTGFGDQWTATPKGIERTGPGSLSSYRHFADSLSDNLIPF